MAKIKLSENFLAQAGHVGWGYLLLTIPVLLTGSFSVMWGTLILLLLAEGGKEYWDCHGLEDDDDSGGVVGSWEDFSFWSLGNSLAVVVLAVARHLDHL